MLYKDVYTYYMNDIFDTKDSKGTIYYNSTHGQVISPLNVLTEKKLEAGHKEVASVEYINSQTFAAIIDNNNFYIQTVDLEGLTFLKTGHYVYTKLAADIRCDDIEVYYPTNKMYATCESKKNPESPLSVIQMDLETGKVDKVIEVPQTAQSAVKTRSRFLFAKLPQGPQKTNKTFLIISDQAASSAGNPVTFFHVLSGVDTGALAFYATIDVKTAIPTLKSIQNVFLFDTYILLAVTTTKNDNQKMYGCSMDNDGKNVTFVCAESIRKESSVTSGYIGLTIHKNYTEYDAVNKNLKICPVGRDFASKNWIDYNNCKKYTNLQGPSSENVNVQLVEDNSYNFMVNWINQEGAYQGVTFGSYEMNKIWYEDKTAGTIINRQFIQVIPTAFQIRRLVPEYILLNGSNDLSTGFNAIQVGVRDDDADRSVAVQFGVNLQKDPRNFFKWGQSYRLPEVDVYEGTKIYYPLSENDFKGNDVKFEAKATPDSLQNSIKFKTYTTYELNINFIMKDGDSNNFKRVAFSPNFAIGQDDINGLIYMACGRSENTIKESACTELYTVNPTGGSPMLEKWTKEILGFTLAWASEQKVSYLYFFGPYRAFSFAVPFKAADIHAVKKDAQILIFATNADDNTISQYIWDPETPNSWKEFKTITKQDIGVDFFCPRDVYDTLEGDEGYVEILSVCKGSPLSDQHIYKLSFPELKLQTKIPIDLDVIDPQVCAVNNTYVITSPNMNVIFGRPQSNDQARFFFYLEEYISDIKNIIDFNCAAESGMVTIFFQDSKNNVFMANLYADSLHHGSKRIHSIVSTLPTDTKKIETSSNKDYMVHTVYTSEKHPRYYISLAKAPNLEVTVDNIQDDQTELSGELTLTLKTSDKNSVSTKDSINLRKIDSQVTINLLGNEAQPSEDFSLEEYISIEGNVFNATLNDQRPNKLNKIELKQRATDIFTWEPMETDQVVYDHMEAMGGYTVLLNNNNLNSGFFVIFTENHEYAGTLTPGGGIQSFDVTTALKGSAILAYCSTPSSGLDLNFLYIEGNQRKYSVAFPFKKNYMKIRFTTIDEQKEDYLLFLWDADTLTVDVMHVNLIEGTIFTETVDHVTNVREFDTDDSGDFIALYHLGIESETLGYTIWRKSDPKNHRVADSQFKIQDNRFWLNSVACAHDQKTNGTVCIVNTIGTKMFEVVIKYNEKGEATPKLFQMEKYANYDGKYMYVQGNYVAIRSISSKAPRNYAFLLWERVSQGGNGKLYAGVPIQGKPTPGVNVNSGFTPFTMVRNEKDEVLLVAGTHDSFRPLIFYHIEPFRIMTTNSASLQQNPHRTRLLADDTPDLDFDDVYITVNSYHSSSAPLTLGKITNSNHKKTEEEKEKSISWVVYALLVLVILLLVAVLVILIYRLREKAKSKEQVDLYEDQYKSMPDAQQRETMDDGNQ